MYNGWKNRETWNVALYINNDYGLYQSAREFMRSYKGRSPYSDFIESVGLYGKKTADGVRWSDRKLNLRELNSMMRDLR